MDILGKIRKLTRVLFSNNGNDTTIEPGANTALTDDVTFTLAEEAGPSSHEITTNDSTQTITNKSVDADNNTITNIADDEIKALAAIDVAKLHDGSVDNTEFGYLDGVTSSIQTQIDDKADDSALTAHTGDATIHFTEASIDHANILNVGTNAHSVIDAHIADGTLHFTEASIDHTAITNVGTNSHTDIDSHIADSTLHFTEASIDHDNITNSGTNTHTAIDSHIADSSLHFTEASIDHNNIANNGTTSHADIDTHIANVLSNPHAVDAADVGLGNVDNTSDATKNSAAVTLTNKTIDADNNTISNIGTDELTNLGVTTAKIADDNVTSAKLEHDIDLPGTGAVGVPTGTNAQRPGSPAEGQFRRNSEAEIWEGYTGTEWEEIGTGSSEGGGGGKNYVLNPSAAIDTTNVANTTAGTWTITRTTTLAELPEPSVGTAFKISGSTLTVGDTVEWAILTDGIDDADGGRFGRAKVSVKDISGTINGEYSIQVYNVTDSVYVGDSDTITGTGTYYLDVPFVAENDYEFHLTAETASPTNIGISSVTIEPVSQTVAGVIGKWKSYTPDNTQGLGTITSRLQWRENGQNIEIIGDLDTGTTTASEAQIELPNSYTVKLEDSTSTVYAGRLGRNASSVRADLILLATDGDTYLNVGDHDTSAYNPTTPLNGNAFAGISNRLTIRASIPVAELASAHTPTASDVQYENAYSEYEDTDGPTITTGTYGLIKFQDKIADTQSNYDTSTGIWTCPATGRYAFDLKFSFTTAVTGVTGAIIKSGDQGTSGTGAISAGFNTDDRYPVVSDVLSLTAGDEISFHAYQATGGNKTVGSSGGLFYHRFSVTRIPDYSARKASLPFATEDEYGLVFKPSMARFTLSADQTLTGTGNQTIAWDTTEGGGIFSVSSGVVTVDRACSVEVDWQLATDISLGNTTARLFVDRGSGATAEYLSVQDQNAAGGFFTPPFRFSIFDLNAGDTFYVTQNESNASTVDVQASSSQTFLTVKSIT